MIRNTDDRGIRVSADFWHTERWVSLTLSTHRLLKRSWQYFQS